MVTGKRITSVHRSLLIYSQSFYLPSLAFLGTDNARFIVNFAVNVYLL